MSNEPHHDTEFLMDTLHLTETAKPRTFKSHSSFCLSSPTDARDFDDEIWIRVGIPPVTCATQAIDDNLMYNSNSAENKSVLGSRRNGKYEPLNRGKNFRNLEQNTSEDVISRKARWIIITTTLLLVFMSMLLVGITLRLAPVIDDLVRKETDKIIGALTSSITISPEGRSNNETTATTVKPG
ncbi:uncharacterized protein [Centruroides vittatus]|uniref:uncharacterized protein isoform X2 n=1 Tax=Centruroides vittatus TaxID=120091 RepID=UPI00350EE6B7